MKLIERLEGTEIVYSAAYSSPLVDSQYGISERELLRVPDTGDSHVKQVVSVLREFSPMDLPTAYAIWKKRTLEF